MSAAGQGQRVSLPDSRRAAAPFALLTICWAQWRILRNHLPRTTFGSLLGVAIAVIWYGGFTVLATVIAVSLPGAPVAALRHWLGAALFGVFFFWQVIPLVTLTGGWSLDLKRLQVFPLSVNSLLIAEVVLRLTAAGEMLLLLLGAAVGAAFNPELPWFAPLALLLFIPFNLLVSLTVRDLLSTAFQKKSYVREIFALALIFVGVVPQLLARYYLPRHDGQGILSMLNARLTPWHGVASLATGGRVLLDSALVIAWLAVAFGVARWQFARALKTEEALSTPPRQSSAKGSSFFAGARTRFTAGFSNLFLDPAGAIIEKELRTLVRMPRFRVIFLLASVFSVVVFLPLRLGAKQGGNYFSQHGVEVMSVYGMLILSDALLWNMFGFDRSAAQVYFVTPVTIATVMRAKNVVATLFIALQTTACLVFATLFGVRFTPMMLLTGLCGTAVTALLFLCIGNITSIANVKAADPRATLRKQNGGATQLWMLACTACSFGLLGAAYFSGWAADSPWATVAVEMLEIAIGIIAYRFSVESAVERVTRDREAFLSALDKTSSPVSS